MGWPQLGQQVVPASTRLVAQMDGEAGEMAVLLVCNKCRQREILSVG